MPKKKTLLIIGTGVLAIFIILMLIFKGPINDYFSLLYPVKEGNEVYRNSKNMLADVNVNSENVIIQPMKFSARTSRISVLINKVVAKSPTDFEFTLYDEYGNVFGKNIINTSDIREKKNEYVKVEFITKTDRTYFLEIKPYENANTAELSLANAQAEADFPSLLINKEEQSGSLITSTITARPRNFVKRFIPIAILIYFIYIAIIIFKNKKERRLNDE